MPFCTDPVHPGPDDHAIAMGFVIAEAVRHDPLAVASIRASLVRHIERVKRGDLPVLPNPDGARQLQITLDMIDNLCPITLGSSADMRTRMQ